MNNARVLGLALSLSLCGCDSGVEYASKQGALSYSPESPESIVFADEMTPASVSDAIRDLQSSNGEIAQTSGGRFDIQDETPFCHLGKGFGLDSELMTEAFLSLGQSPNDVSGSDRFFSFENHNFCAEPGVILSRSFQSYDPEQGYEMTIAVWQVGNAYWVGTIARPDGIHPSAKDWPPPSDGNPISVVSGSMLIDLRELTESFVRHIVGSNEQ